jgi:hypothetical protein
LTAGTQLAGGAGTSDKLVLLDTAVSATEFTKINATTGFEVLGFRAAAAAVDASSLTSIKDFSLDAAANQSFTNLKTGSSITVTATHNNTIGVGMGVGVTDVTINLGKSTYTGGILASTLTVGATAVKLTSNGTSAAADVITTLANADNSSYVITGTNALTITNATASTTTGSKYDASGLSGVLTMIGNTTAYSAGSSIGDIIIGGSAADSIKASVNSSSLTGNAGADTFNVEATPAAATASAAITLITDFTKGDKIDFAASAGAFTATKVDISASATEQAAIDALVAGSNSDLKWGTYNGFTYIADDVATNATMQATDFVVKLTGTLDLATSTLSATVLTYA